MVTINSVSGGQTSAYMMHHFPADYNLFALVRINQPSAAPKDPWIKKYVESKINDEFIATAEDDRIVYTMADLEQFTGQRIDWVTNPSFDEVVSRTFILPNVSRRFCTQKLKVEPVAQWVYDNVGEPIESRLGFRANELSRVERVMENHDEKTGLRKSRVVVTRKNGTRGGKNWGWCRNAFPLVENRIFRDNIVEFWRDKPVRFAERNNCIGCFHRNPLLLNLMSQQFPEKFQWFVDLEQRKMHEKSVAGKSVAHWNTFRRDATYQQIQNHKTQLTLDDLDGFNDCDSGFCGL